MLSGSEASRNQGKGIEPSPYRLLIAADSSLPLSMTPFFVSA
jgi:hypothetical protein